MKKIVIFGCGSFAKTLTYYIEKETDWNIVCYCTDLIVEEKMIYNKPYIPFSKLNEKYPNSEYEVVMGIGYKNMNTLREEKYKMLKSLGYKFPNLIHSSAIINNTIIGDGNIILENVVIEPNTVIGNNCIIWSSVLIGHDCKIGDNNHFAACSLIAGNVTVNNNCFFGNHSTVKNGRVVSNYTLLGANAYASKDTKEYEVIVPARSIVLSNHVSIDFI